MYIHVFIYVQYLHVFTVSESRNCLVPIDIKDCQPHLRSLSSLPYALVFLKYGDALYPWQNSGWSSVERFEKE